MSNRRNNAHAVWELVDAKKAILEDLSDRVWGTPELLYEEFRSARSHQDVLEQQGFRVTPQLGGIATALMGEAGEGGAIIAILGEYDALPGLSQQAGVDHHQPMEEGGSGHGCGHNLLGAGALLAATAIKDYLALNNLPGRVRYYGCPAEEGGAAKAFLVRDGHFADVDAALSWHPMAFNGIIPPRSLAATMIDFHFTGRAAHAAANPHLGRSALDAVELMNVGVNYLREHVPSDARIHYAIIDSGGRAPNVVQAKATVRYSVRALRRVDMVQLVERVKLVAAGAALMTETQVSSTILAAMSELLDNGPLYALLHKNFEDLGPTQFDSADRAFAAKMQKTFSKDEIEASYLAAGVPIGDAPICDQIVPLAARGLPMYGSTDVGDVSWVVPLAQAAGATFAIGTPGHTWQMTAQGKTKAAHKGMVQVAKALAATAVDLLTQPETLADAKADFAARTAVDPYVSPLPHYARSIAQ